MFNNRWSIKFTIKIIDKSKRSQIASLPFTWNLHVKKMNELDERKPTNISKKLQITDINPCVSKRWALTFNKILHIYGNKWKCHAHFCPFQEHIQTAILQTRFSLSKCESMRRNANINNLKCRRFPEQMDFETNSPVQWDSHLSTSTTCINQTSDVW